MATPAEVLTVRRKSQEQGTEVYSDTDIEVLIDEHGVEGALGEIWEEKVGRFVALVDVAEGSSRRSMSQQHAHALKMLAIYKPSTAGGTTEPARAKVHRLTRL